MDVARRLREEVENGLYHVYARGNDKRAIFLDDADRLAYLRMLARVVRRKRWRCLAYCLMKNHVHLLLETPETNLASGIQAFHGRFAQAFNFRHKRTGHLFGGRYGAVRIASDAQLAVATAYIVRNPVEAGLVGGPEEWPWSSHLATLGYEQAPDWLDVGRLLSFFANGDGDPRRRYSELVTRPAGLVSRS